jgi:hypothetical protein
MSWRGSRIANWDFQELALFNSPGLLDRVQNDTSWPLQPAIYLPCCAHGVWSATWRDEWLPAIYFPWWLSTIISNGDSFCSMTGYPLKESGHICFSRHLRISYLSIPRFSDHANRRRITDLDWMTVVFVFLFRIVFSWKCPSESEKALAIFFLRDYPVAGDTDAWITRDTGQLLATCTLPGCAYHPVSMCANIATSFWK